MTKVGSQSQIWAEHRRWEISYALAGQWVELVRLQDRVGLSLPYRNPGTRSRQPAGHGRGPLVGGLSSKPKNV